MKKTRCASVRRGQNRREGAEGCTLLTLPISIVKSGQIMCSKIELFYLMPTHHHFVLDDIDSCS
jgi:hypothetical protein